MRKAAPMLAAICLAMCLCLLPRKATTTSQDTLIGDSSFPLATIPDDRGTVTADLNDSDEFFHNAIRSRARKPDYSHKIESLLKQITAEEKVSQMTQLDHPAFATEGDRSAIRPQFEFGDGLSYTSFGYRELCLDKQTISGREDLA
jgi:hypothetical protein